MLIATCRRSILLSLFYSLIPSAGAAALATPTTAILDMTLVDKATDQPSPVIPIASGNSLSSPPPATQITEAPSLAHLDLRQRCWNDQGFAVDCAVWTGYRYTWGPPSNPYDYWSGNGGSGSGDGNVNGNGDNALVTGDAGRLGVDHTLLGLALGTVIGVSVCALGLVL